MTMTKVVASPSGRARLTLCVTPRKGHMPRNMASTKLPDRMEVTRIWPTDSRTMTVPLRDRGAPLAAAADHGEQQQPAAHDEEAAGRQHHHHPGLEIGAEQGQAEQRAAAQH